MKIKSKVIDSALKERKDSIIKIGVRNNYLIQKPADS